MEEHYGLRGQRYRDSVREFEIHVIQYLKSYQKWMFDRIRGNPNEMDEKFHLVTMISRTVSLCTVFCVLVTDNHSAGNSNLQQTYAPL